MPVEAHNRAVCLLLLCRGKKNENLQFFLDVAKAMLTASLDKDHGTGPDVRLLGPDLHMCPPADHIIEFIFVMGLLRVLSSRRQNINARAQGGHAQKLQVEFAAFGAFTAKVVDVKETSQLRTRKQEQVSENFYPIAPRKKISVYCRTIASPVSVPAALYH